MKKIKNTKYDGQEKKKIRKTENKKNKKIK